jgi:hypothetical protein
VIATCIETLTLMVGEQTSPIQRQLTNAEKNIKE